MTTDTQPGSEAPPVGLAGIPTYIQVSRDLVALWVGATEQIVRLSAETTETAIETVRTRFGRWAVPAATDLWNWWANTAAGFLGAYRDTIQNAPAAPPLATTSETGRPTIEVDVTKTATADVATRQRAAAAEVGAPKATASTSRRSRTGH